MAKTSKYLASGTTSDRAPVHTDWWTGRQDVDARDVLKLDRVRKHIERVKDLPIKKKVSPKSDERRA